MANPKKPCRVTVTSPGWEGARAAAIAAGCSSVSDMLERLGSGELSVITSDAIAADPVNPMPANPMPVNSRADGSLRSPLHTARQTTPHHQSVPQHIHIHTPAAVSALPKDHQSDVDTDDEGDGLPLSDIPLPRLIVTGLCAAIIVGSLLFIADRIMNLTAGGGSSKETVEDIVTPRTGDTVAGYEVTDEYGIRPFHPVTGAPNVPHNGVDLATPIGTPIHAVGKAGDTTTVKCWWDVDGGGWVVNQTADSYPGYVFQSLHMSENGCRAGESKAGEVIAFSGNSGLGTGAHYDFRVKIDGGYVPPATKYLESAMTGKSPKE